MHSSRIQQLSVGQVQTGVFCLKPAIRMLMDHKAWEAIKRPGSLERMHFI